MIWLINLKINSFYIIIFIKMKKDKKYTIIDKKDLFDYLDGYSFIDENEVHMCICDFIDNQNWCLYWSDCLLAGELCDEYIEKRKITF